MDGGFELGGHRPRRNPSRATDNFYDTIQNYENCPYDYIIIYCLVFTV